MNMTQGMNTPYSMLVVDDEESILKLFKKELSSPLRSVHLAMNGAHAREMVRQQQFDVIVLDIRLPDADGMELLTEFKGRLPDVEVIMITGHGSIDDAVEAMKVGAYDYITKPFHLDEIELVIERAHHRVCLERENRGFKHQQASSRTGQQLVGNSAAIRQVSYLVEKVAPTDVPVLITGDSGAGKDVVAHAVHDLSLRAESQFIVKNCATLQKELARSELFGHTRGSFTGATDDREGLMTFAHKGTLFLDEIGELPLEVQGSLLRVLESRSYRRVGEKEERQTDVRFLFATNRNLAAEVEAGRFHEALFHRINVFNIDLPTLAERKEDIPLLVEHFLARLTAGKPRVGVADRAMQCMMAYQWPGNVRELRNVLERSLILAENGLITDHALPKEIAQGPNVCIEASTPLALESVEREHIAKVLAFFDGNRLKAAEALGIGRKTLYRKIQKFELD